MDSVLTFGESSGTDALDAARAQHSQCVFAGAAALQDKGQRLFQKKKSVYIYFRMCVYVLDALSRMCVCVCVCVCEYIYFGRCCSTEDKGQRVFKSRYIVFSSRKSGYSVFVGVFISEVCIQCLCRLNVLGH